jgi:hypothetical protein
MANPKIYIVETPVKGFCGVGAAGVQFAYGKAEVAEGWVLDWFKDHGYKVTEKAAEQPAADPFSGMNKDDLKAYAAEHGVDLTNVPDKKADILTAIKAAEGK